MAIALRRRRITLARRIEAYAGMRLVDNLGQGTIVRDVFAVGFDVFTLNWLLVAVMVVFRIAGAGRWLVRSSVVTFADGICIPVYTSTLIIVIMLRSARWAFSASAAN